jgi:DNA-binding IclR family transcriptional regulator
METEEQSSNAVSTRTVDRALVLLTNVLEGAAGDTLSELARATRLSPSTASRLLATLAQHELIQRDDYGHYRPGIRMKQLAATALRGDQLYELSGPHLEHLVTETGETASLGIPLGAEEVLYLRQTASTHQVQTIVWTGRTIPRKGTALGAALDNTSTQTGYLVSQRPDSDVVAVAVPVRQHSGRIIGAISINAPAYRTTPADIERFGAALLSHGLDLSLQLGMPDPGVDHL